MAKVLKSVSVLKPNGEKETVYEPNSGLVQRVADIESLINTTEYIVSDTVESGVRIIRYNTNRIEYSGITTPPNPGIPTTVTITLPQPCYVQDMFSTSAVDINVAIGMSAGICTTQTVSQWILEWGGAIEPVSSSGLVTAIKVMSGGYKYWYVRGYLPV